MCVQELHADFLEQNLLSQVRAASANQQICAWVGPSKSLIRMQVGECRVSKSLRPLLKQCATVSTEPSDDVAVRLTIDTEVAIAPKSRLTSTSSAIAQQRHQLNTGVATKERPKTNGHISRRKAPCLLRLLPADVDSDEICKLPQSTSASEQLESRVWVDNRTFRHMSEVLQTDWVVLTRYASPANRSKKSATDSRDGRNGQADPPDGQHEGIDSQSVVARLCGTTCLPTGSLYVSSDVRKQLPPDVVDFDLIQLSASAASDQTSPRLAASVDAGIRAGAIPASDRPAPFAGFDKQIELYLEGLRATLYTSAAATRGRCFSHGILITGASGSGKTSFARQVERRAQHDPDILAKVVRQDCVSLATLRMSTLQQKLQEILDAAIWHAPSLIIFDDLDRLAPAEVEHIDSAHSQQVANVILRMVNEAVSLAPIAIMATCQSQGSLHAALSQSHMFDEYINMLAPNKDARTEVRKVHCHARYTLRPSRRFYERGCWRRQHRAPVWRSPRTSIIYHCRRKPRDIYRWI